jgi:hypothetical protein
MTLRSRAQHVEKLATLPTIIPGYDVEHALHELCHAATLGLAFDSKDGFVTNSVSDAILGMRTTAADWNEVWTIAAELRAAALLGWDVGSAMDLLAGNVSMSSSRALLLISERVWTERAYGYACAAILGAEVAVAAFEAAYPWWPGRPAG